MGQGAVRFERARDVVACPWQASPSSSSPAQASIDGETISEAGRSAYAGSTAADFDAMGESLNETVAAFYFFCTDEAPKAGTARHWVIISWVPDLAKVRDKMLYSSSRDDLRKTLGMGYFPTDYYANEKSDMTWATYSKGLERNDAPLSATEQLQKEEAMMERDTCEPELRQALSAYDKRNSAPRRLTYHPSARTVPGAPRHVGQHLRTTLPPQPFVRTP